MSCAGAVVDLVGLNDAPHLNGRRAVVVRTFAPVRFKVYVLSSISNDSRAQFLHVSPNNLIVKSHPIVNPGCTKPSNSEHGHDIRLNTLGFSKIPDCLPYPEGPTSVLFNSQPPTYLFRSVPTSAFAQLHTSVRVLCLACWDIASPLYSLYHADTATTDNNIHVQFTLNDTEPSVFARNLVMLWLIVKTQCPVAYIVQIWFSLAIPSGAYAYLLDAVTALTGPAAADELNDLGVSFVELTHLSQVQNILWSWVTWADQFPARTELVRDRDKALRPTWRGRDPTPNVATTIYSRHIAKGDESFPKKACEQELASYFSTGCLHSDEEQTYTNPTLFRSPNKYSLHPESIPLTSAPPFSAAYAPTRPMQSAIHDHMAKWVGCLRARRRRSVTWMFHIGDCVSFAQGLPRTDFFDVVAMSSISDSVGILPVLEAVKGLPRHAVLVRTRMHCMYRGFAEEMLVDSFGHLRLEMMPAVLGWRCIGYEGQELQHPLCDGPEFVTPGAEPRDLEYMLLFQPATAPDVKLNISDNAQLWAMYKVLRNRLHEGINMDWGSENAATSKDSYMIGKRKARLECVHPFVLLPTLVNGHGDLFGNKTIGKNDVEFCDVYHALIGRKKRDDIVSASVTIPVSQFGVWGYILLNSEMARRGMNMGIYHIQLDSGTLYFALAAAKTKKNKWRISWLMAHHRLRSSSNVSLRLGNYVIAIVPCENVTVSKKTSLRTWFQNHSFSEHKSDCVVSAIRVERPLVSEISIHLRRKKQLSIARKLETEIVSGDNCTVCIRQKAESAPLICRLRVPYPVQSARTETVLKWDTDEAVLNLSLKKKPYSFLSGFPRGSFTKSTWISDKRLRVSRSHALSLEKLSMSPEQALVSFLDCIHWSENIYVKKLISCLFKAVASEFSNIKMTIEKESDENSQDCEELTLVMADAFVQQEQTGCIGLPLRWTHSPYRTARCTPYRGLEMKSRNILDFDDYCTVSPSVFDAILLWLEALSDGDVKHVSEVSCKDSGESTDNNSKKGIEVEVKSMWCKKAVVSKSRSVEAFERLSLSRSRIRDGRAILVLAPWACSLPPGMEADFESTEKEVSTGLKGWRYTVQYWKEAGLELVKSGQLAQSIAMFEMGAAHGVAFLEDSLGCPERSCVNVGEVQAVGCQVEEESDGQGKVDVVICLLNAAKYKWQLKSGTKYVVPYCHRAVELLEGDEKLEKLRIEIESLISDVLSSSPAVNSGKWLTSK